MKSATDHDPDASNYIESVKTGPRFKDITGQTFGLLTVIGKSCSKLEHGTWTWFWFAECQCGKVIEIAGKLLRRANRRYCSKQCGLNTKLGMGQAQLNKMYSKKMKRAEGNDVVFALSLEEFDAMTKAPCAYCNEPPNLLTKDHAKFGLPRNTIDRQINELGYTVDNAVPCCWPCNRMKQGVPAGPFLLACKQIIDGWSADENIFLAMVDQIPKKIVSLPELRDEDALSKILHPGEGYDHFPANRRVGKMTILRPASTGSADWEIKCDCGAIQIRERGQILGGKHKSCGRAGCRASMYAPEQVARMAFHNLKKAGWSREITLAQVRHLIFRNCFYCKKPPELKPGHSNRKNRKDVLTTGIDRVDSLIGYVVGNVVPCCKQCNLMKLDTPLSSFVDHLLRIVGFKGRVIKQAEPAAGG